MLPILCHVQAIYLEGEEDIFFQPPLTNNKTDYSAFNGLMEK
jgi:hypothetical protein